MPQPANYKDLQKLGLSQTAVKCYESLFKDGHASASQLAKRLQKPRTSIYHALEKLELQGFVERKKRPGWVTHFTVVRLDKALENLAIYQRRVVAAITTEQVERSIRQQLVLNQRE